MNKISKNLTVILVIVFCAISLSYLLLQNGRTSNQVIIYVAHDQDYSEPLLKKFEQESGIKVKAVYDTEVTKTVGLVNRLIAEKNNPQADVFWNNEVSRTILLKREGVLEKYIPPNSLDKPAIYKDLDGYWTGFAARARVLLYNTRFISEDNAPTSIFDLTNEAWKGKIGIANPLFGTTGSHVAALFALLGPEQVERYFKELQDNDLQVVESNGMIRDQVVAGELWVGLTDTDDANDAIVDGKSVEMVFPDQKEMGTLIIPNSVMLIRDSNNPENGQKLIDYLLSSEVERILSESKAMQMPLGQGVQTPDNVPSVNELTAMTVTQEEIYDNLESSQQFVRETLIN